MIIQHGLVKVSYFLTNPAWFPQKKRPTPPVLHQFSPAPKKRASYRAFVVVPLQEFQEVHIQPGQNAAVVPQKKSMFTLWQIVGSRSHGPLSCTIYLLKLVALHGKLARITTEYYHRDIVIYFHMRIQNIPMKYPLYIIIIYIYICIYIIIYISLYHYISSCCIP